MLTEEHSTILGGSKNTVNGAYSTILGGSGNAIAAAYSYAAVFGNGISAQASNTFHVECMNAVGTPGPGGVFPPGTMYWDTIANVMAAPSSGPGACCVLVIA